MRVGRGRVPRTEASLRAHGLLRSQLKQLRGTRIRRARRRWQVQQVLFPLRVPDVEEARRENDHAVIGEIMRHG